ncbi:MAG: iduronate sulfatase [Verrucomicrobia bacterium]|nr:iduronate sulfatase [Verrucomicrobiota bacterium]
MKICYFLLSIGFLLIGCDEKEHPKSSPKVQKPNILFVSIDDLGPNLGVYDNAYIHSPNIDAFAQEGTTFRRTYCQAAVCAPSRASLMTGIRPDSSRVWHLGDKFRKLHPNIVTMPQHFSKHGYYTACIGKIFHNYMPDSVSWDEPDLRPEQYKRKEWLKRDGETFYVNKETQRLQKIKRDAKVAQYPEYYADGWNNGPAWEMEEVHDTLYYDGAQTELAKRTLSRLAKKEQPFYLALGYFRPHLPFAVPKKYWDLYDRDSLPLATNPFTPKEAPVMTMNSMYELRGYDGFQHLKHPLENIMSEDTARTLKQGYYASVSYVDAQFGKVIQHLKDLDIYDNTIIIVWGDHGWKLGEHNGWCKQTNYNIDIHVPMIIRSPGQENPGRQSFALTELIDMYPSLCELARIEVPDYMQGSSFVPLMKDPEQPWKSAAFSQFHRRPKVSPDGKRYMGYSIQTERYHYVEWYEWDADKGKKGTYVTNELYDGKTDPDENENISKLEENKKLIEDLSVQLNSGWKAAMPNNAKN